VHILDHAKLRRTGVVYTKSRWKTVHWIVGEDEQTTPLPDDIPDPWSEMVMKNQYLQELEERWFYNTKNNGRVTKDGTVSFNIVERYHPGLSNEVGPLWFALFVEDINGERFWDNNGGWNYEASGEPGLLASEERGWKGT